MIQDIFPHTIDNHFVPGKTPRPDSPVIAFHGKEVLVRRTEGGLQYPTAAEFPGVPLHYLITFDETDYFFPEEEPGTRRTAPLAPDLPDAPGHRDDPEGYEHLTIRTLRKSGEIPQYQMFLLMTAFQLHNWYMDNRYCGTCGNRTELDETERAMRCPHCGRKIYPRIIPAVIVGVTNGDKLLMTKYADRPGQRIPYYALVAGFVEIGETFEECVQREVMEEVGLKVKNIRYYKSQPWGIVDDLLAGYYCDVDGDDTIHMDRTELKKAVWVPRPEIIGQPDNYSLTNEMMEVFREGDEPR